MKEKRITPFMNGDVTMRKNPVLDWSDGLAVFRSPDKRLPGDDAILALLYADHSALERDYRRSARWRPVRGARASAHSLYIEKTSSGQAWCSFGKRHYFKGFVNRQRGFRKSIAEPAEEWIAVPMLHGGNSRLTVVRATQRAMSLWVVFALYDGADPEALKEIARRLYNDSLGCAPGTEPIALRGLSTLGRFVPTAANASHEGMSAVNAATHLAVHPPGQ